MPSDPSREPRPITVYQMLVLAGMGAAMGLTVEHLKRGETLITWFVAMWTWLAISLTLGNADTRVGAFLFFRGVVHAALSIAWAMLVALIRWTRGPELHYQVRVKDIVIATLTYAAMLQFPIDGGI